MHPAFKWSHIQNPVLYLSQTTRAWPKWQPPCFFAIQNGDHSPSKLLLGISLQDLSGIQNPIVYVREYSGDQKPGRVKFILKISSQMVRFSIAIWKPDTKKSSFWMVGFRILTVSYQHSIGPFSMGLSLTPVATSQRWMVESKELQTKSENKSKKQILIAS